MSSLIADLPFADDLMNIAITSVDLQYFIDRFAAACIRWGLTVSIKTTQVLMQPEPAEMANRCVQVKPSSFVSIEGTAREEVP